MNALEILKETMTKEINHYEHKRNIDDRYYHFGRIKLAVELCNQFDHTNIFILHSAPHPYVEIANKINHEKVYISAAGVTKTAPQKTAEQQSFF